jgi:predicted transglutaminase-like cysteine proteinase
MSVFIQSARALFLVGFCCSTFTNVHSGQVFWPPESHGRSASDFVPASALGDIALPELHSVAPDLPKYSEKPTQLLPTAAPSGEMPAGWNELQGRILADITALAACRMNELACGPAAHRFLSIVELGRKQQGRARLGWINRAVNLSIMPKSDWAQYGRADFWASPLQTLTSGAGDCEDYAILKYVALRELGIIASDLRFVIVRDNMRQTDHAVIAVRDDERWLILDNRTMAILSLQDIQHYRPLFALDEQNIRTTAAPIGDRIVGR